jgi:hypothetical protein
MLGAVISVTDTTYGAGLCQPLPVQLGPKLYNGH